MDEYSPTGFSWFTGSLNIPLKDMSPGGRNQAPFALGIQRVGTLICHEDLTGQEVRRWLPSATLLLNPSNLAWFEGSLAIGQRLQIVRMRALESGRPILRVTNTGVTAQIDAQGRVLGRLPVSVEGVLSGTVQPQQGVTPYGRWGDWPAVLASAMCVLLAGNIQRRRRMIDTLSG
ncbi:MAG: apolipoprotein N-acyltransferase [Sulfurimicrobium sp.]|nr:apolipoprotein N-acyltransferase [Sulfurimicrobium sp.]MDP2198925.1 apolipoprotein N-acyltransferase [Sulfurimicrobium sp.]MDP3689039.1 apolipoprotein N-acyltransferase [Sulfurimicrobium sp.]